MPNLLENENVRTYLKGCLPQKLKYGTKYRIDNYGEIDVKSGVTSGVQIVENASRNNDQYFQSDIDQSFVGQDVVLRKTISDSKCIIEKPSLHHETIINPDVNIREDIEVRSNGLVDEMTSNKFLDQSGKWLYANLVDQKNRLGEVQNFPYRPWLHRPNGDLVFPGDVEIYRNFKERVSPETFKRITDSILNKVQISQEDLYYLVSSLPETLLDNILFPIKGALTSYNFWNTYMYSTLLGGDNYLSSTAPNRVAWAKGFGSLLLLAYKASKGSFNVDGYLVLFDHYCHCCRYINNIHPYITIMPGIEQTYSIVQNRYMPVYDLTCIQNFNSYIINKCNYNVRSIILTGLRTPGWVDIEHSIDLLDMFIRVQDMHGIHILKQAHMCPGQYPNTLAILNYTQYADVGLEGLGELIVDKITELENKYMISPNMLAGDKNYTFNFVCLSHWG